MEEETRLKINELKKSPTTSFERQNFYSCCFKGKTDRRILEFIARYTISLSILCFSFTMIATNQDPCNGQIPFYTSLITLVCGYYINHKVKSKTELD